MSKTEYSREYVIARFLEVKDGPNERLTHKHAIENYDWYSSACTLFGTEYHRWYDALEKLYVEYGGKTAEEAKAKIAEIRDLRRQERSKRFKARVKFSRKQVVDEFLKVKDAPNKQLLHRYADANYLWCSSACTHFGRRYHDWYSALEKLYVEHGGMSEEQARKKMNEIRASGGRHAAKAVVKQSIRRTREEVIAEFIKVKDAPDEQLTLRYAEENYAWLSSAGTHFRRESGDWYGALKQLYERHGGMTPAEAEEKIGRIKRVAVSYRAASRKARERVIAEFIKMKDAPNNELTLTYARDNYAWYTSACTHFGKGNDNWYEALEKLYVEHGGMTQAQAKEKIEAIRKTAKRHMGELVGRRSLLYTREQVRNEFLRVVNRPDAELMGSYAAEHYPWFSSAGTHFGKRGLWYTALRSMLVECAGYEEARADERITHIRSIVSESQKKAWEARRSKPMPTGGFDITTTRRPLHGKSADYSLARSVFTELGAGAVKTRLRVEGKIRASMESEGAVQPTQAQKARHAIGTAEWRGEWGSIAEQYVAALPKTASFIRDRALAAFIAKLASEGRITMPSTILSQASGPGQLYDAIQDLKPAFEKAGRVPVVTDLDVSEEMLVLSRNPNIVQGDVRRMPVPDKSFEAVENSSITQFKPIDAKAAMLEASRALPNGGLLVLSTIRKRFSEDFHEGVKQAGFEVITRQGEVLALSPEMVDALKARFGKAFAAKAKDAARRSFVLVAKKTREPEQNIPAALFSFERSPERRAVRLIAAKARDVFTALEKQDGTCERMLDAQEPRERRVYRRLHEQASTRADEAIRAYLATLDARAGCLRHKLFYRLTGTVMHRVEAWRQRANKTTA